MNNILTKRVLVLGAKGRLGQAAVIAFSDAGWQVVAQARSAMDKASLGWHDEVQLLVCDALDTDTVIAAAPNMDAVVHAIDETFAQLKQQFCHFGGVLRRESLNRQAAQSVIRIIENTYS